MIPISKPYLGKEEKDAVMQVLESGMLAQGPKVAELEAGFKKVCETTEAIAASSGTTALHLALLAHGIGPGDEVITTPFTFIASVNSILFVGAKPVFVDIDTETFNIDPRLIEKKITKKTKAILPVHLYGLPCDMDAISMIAQEHKLAVIEDACQAIGARFKNKAVGSFGTACFSLYATKNIMSGEGGMITTNDSKIAERCRLLRSHGMKVRYYHEMLGYNFRLSDLHAAIGCAQLQRLDEFTHKRQKNAEYLNSHLTSVITPKSAPGFDHVWHQYTVKAKTGTHRDEAVQHLNSAGVGTAVFYPVPAHQQSYIIETLGKQTLPVTEELSKQVFSLPVHPFLTEGELKKIVQEVNNL